MNFLDKINEKARSAADKANNTLEIGRLQGKIHTEKKNMAEIVRRLGEYCLSRLDAGEELDEETALLHQEIINCREKINTFEADIEKLRAANSKKAPEKIKCSLCGNMNQSNTKFCGECGNKLEVVSAPCCAVCGTELVEGLKFCSECGTKIE